jgi:signal-transduction protein with cAMP-binding, CBS, and nucleotidyltransferase domain
MIVSQILTDTIPNLSAEDSAQRALHYMEFFRLAHLPICDGRNYVGLVQDESILAVDQSEFRIKACELQLKNTFVYDYQHAYDALFLMSQYKLTLVAVVDEDMNFMGSISQADLINAISQMTSIDQSGSILVLKTGIRDYSLSEISQIVESNQVKILSSYIQTCPNQTHIRVTLKLNTNDLDAIKLTFERYSYTIEAVFSENKVLDEMYKSRLDEFLHYMNI